MQEKTSDMSYGGTEQLLFGLLMCHQFRVTDKPWGKGFAFIVS
jgi:hypothetical protein